MSQKRAVSKSSRSAKLAKASSTKGKGSGSVHFKLKNGLDVRLVPSSKSPVVSVQMWVKTGSADERRAEEGISHFIEHLLFKGTRKYQVGEIAKTVEASGGELNAWTSFDQTVFYVNISKEFTTTAMDVIADMMGFPLFDATEIDAEREVVLEEIKRTNDSPSRKGSRLLFSSVYRKHPYRLPVIGRPEVIKTVKPAVLKRYFKERYSAKNMVLVIGGDFDVKQMKGLVAERFSELPGSRVRAVKRAAEPKTLPRGKKIYAESSDVQELQLFITWPMPNAKHKDAAALETLGSIFGQGDSSRLVRTLRIDSDCVTSVGAGCFAPKDHGFFSISATMNPTNLEEALKRIGLETVGLLRKPVLDSEIFRAVTGIESSEFYGLETADGLARKVGSLTTLLGDPSEFQKYLKRVQAFDAKQARTMALKYLDPSRAHVVALVPKDQSLDLVKKSLHGFLDLLSKEWSEAKKEKTAVGRISKGTSKRKTKSPKAWVPQADGKIEIERRTLSSGLKVIARRTRSTPVVSARLAFLGGARIEAANICGATELLSRTWISGTKDLNEVELLHRIEAQAAGIGAFGGRHTAGVSAQLLSRSEREIQELFVETAMRPVFTDEIIARERTMMLESLRTRADRPGQIAGRIFMETMFEGHPYALDPMGTEASLSAIDAKSIQQLHQTNICPADGIFVLTGDADLDSWCDLLETATKPYSSKRTKFFKKPYKWAGKAEVRKFHEIKKEQSTILIGWPGITLDDPRRHALQIAQAVLAGQGGRLFIELRDKKSLAYSVGPMAMEGVDSGYFGASIGCTPEKGELAISMLKDEFQKLATTRIPQAEMERAVRYLIGSHDLGLQRATAVSSTILFSEIYGISAESVFQYADVIRAVTADDVQKLMQEILSVNPITVAAGPKAPW